MIPVLPHMFSFYWEIVASKTILVDGDCFGRRHTFNNPVKDVKVSELQQLGIQQFFSCVLSYLAFE